MKKPDGQFACGTQKAASLAKVPATSVTRPAKESKSGFRNRGLPRASLTAASKRAWAVAKAPAKLGVPSGPATARPPLTDIDELSKWLSLSNWCVMSVFSTPRLMSRTSSAEACGSPALIAAAVIPSWIADPPCGCVLRKVAPLSMSNAVADGTSSTSAETATARARAEELRTGCS